MRQDQREWLHAMATGMAKHFAGTTDTAALRAFVDEARPYWLARPERPESADVLRTFDEIDSDLAARCFGPSTHSRAWLGRWGSLGMPVCIPHDLHWAESMCATNIPEEVIALMKPAWPAFAVKVPTGLGLEDDDGAQFELLGVYFPDTSLETREDGERVVIIHAWSDRKFTDCGAWRACLLRDICKELHEGTIAYETEDNVGGDEQVMARSLQMAGKLIVGCLMALDAGQREQTSAKSKSRRRKLGAFPTECEWLVGAPVVVRVGEFVKAFVRMGGRGIRAIRTLVRGHWKNQPYGPKSTLRKFMHIEPYWQGDGPVVTRPHVLKSTKKPGEGEGGAPPQAAE